MSDDDKIWNDPAWLVAEVKRLRGVIEGMGKPLQIGPLMTSALVQVNLFRNKQLDDIGELLCSYSDVAPDTEQPDPVASLTIKRIGEVLQRERPQHIGPPAAMTVAFHWRDQKRTDGYFDALPGDGFGFCEYVDNDVRKGLMMQFQCAGITAVATLEFEALRKTLAEEGYSICPWPCSLP